MDFISNTESQNAEMLKQIGVTSVEQLFKAISPQLQCARPPIDDGISEFEGLRHMEALADKNRFHELDCYLGAGAYEHHTPALSGAVCAKSEFLTSYTPYQAEASQGMLQAIFEFQSSICALTGLDVANASLYDGASAIAEAALMALRLNKRSQILVSQALHPHYLNVLKLYLENHDVELIEIAIDNNGRTSFEQFKNILNHNTAAVVVQSPNFFGIIEEVHQFSSLAKTVDALTILSANPLSYGLFSSARELGVDIAIGDCQSCGIPLQFGGPYAGYMACKQELIRQLPGRIVGQTHDLNGRLGYVLTLQTREQHIRREKATSNICTNQALAALASLVTMLWYGKEGFHKLALTNYQRAAYLKQNLEKILGVNSFSSSPCFNEFVVQFQQPIKTVQEHFRKHGIEPGLDLEQYFPQFKNTLLVCVTETKNKEQLDRYLRIAKEAN